MKTILKTDKKKILDIKLDKSLDNYDNVVLFPGKLDKAKKMLKVSGLPKVDKQKD